MFLGSRSPIGEVTRHVGRLIDGAATAPSVDDVYELSYFPLRIASKAVQWNAIAYLSILGLYPLMYRAGRRGGGPGAEALLDRSSRHLLEGLWLVLPAMSRDPFGAPDARASNAAGEALRTNLHRLLEATVDIGDFDTFRQVLRRWKSAERRY
jgi:hypothetical protein